MKTLVALSLILLASCAPPPEEEKRTEVRISFPASVKQSALRHYRPQSQFGANSLTNLNDIDCYALAVRYKQGSGHCTDTTNNEILRADMAFGSFPAGSSVELIVPQGDNVTFHLIGFSFPSGTTADLPDGPVAGFPDDPTADFDTPICPDFVSFPIIAQQVAGKPKLLASSEVNVQGDFMEISMTRDIAGPDFFTCKDSPFEWEAQTGDARWDLAQWDQATWGP